MKGFELAAQQGFAEFIPQRTLSVLKACSGAGTATSSPSGIDCGTTCAHAYDQGATVTLTASAAPGSAFSGWSGGGCSGTGTCQVTLSGDTSVTASFADVQPPNTTITAGPSGASKDATPAYSFTSSEAGSTFQCAVDGGAYASCTSPHTTAPLANGTHTFYVRAIDSSSNVDPTPATRTVKVDTHAPSSKASAPASTHASPFTVSYSASDPVPSSGLKSVELWVKRPGQTTYAKVATDERG